MGIYEFEGTTQTYLSKYINNHYKAKPSNNSNIFFLQKPFHTSFSSNRLGNFQNVSQYLNI